MIEKTIEATSPYVNGYITDFGDDTYTLDREDDPTIFFNKAAGGFYYTLKEGDELDALAQRFYGDFRLWHVLAASNRDTLDDFISPLPRGLTIYVPNQAQFNRL